jgi:hypothetical protein
MDDLNARLVRTTVDRIKDFSLHADGGCGVVSGLVAGITYANPPTVFTYTGGDAYVAGTKFTVAPGNYTKTNDAVANRYFWVDGAGAVQNGTAWPGTAHCKLWRMYGSAAAAIIYRIEMGMGVDRDSLQGIDLLNRRVVVPPAANVSTLVVLESYSGLTATVTSTGYGYGIYFVPKRPFLFSGMQMYMAAATTKSVRHGLKLASAMTSWESYREQASVAWGIGAYNWALTAPVMVWPGTTYFWGWQTTDDNFNLGIKGPSPFPNEGSYLGLCYDMGSGGSHRFYVPDTTAIGSTWSLGNSTSQCVTALLGYDAAFGRFRLRPAALAALPGRAMANIGTRRMNVGTGSFNPLAATQYLKYQVSLDDDANWQNVVVGDELVTTYNGTGLILDATVLNDHADEAHITDAGFFYEA